MLSLLPGVPGVSGGELLQPRQCAEVVLEACPAVSAYADAMPEDLERVVAFRGVLRQRFLRCPQCERLATVLFDPDGAERWRCRTCARVDYACRHEERDPIIRARALRERLGAPLALA